LQAIRADGKEAEVRPYYRLQDNWALTQLSNGQPFFVDTSSRDISPWIILGGVWEQFVDGLLCALARPGDRFVDVGANMGYYTVKVGQIVGPEGRVYAFEANPDVYPFLTENVEINGHSSRTRAFNLAAGAEPGELGLSIPPARRGGGALLPPGQYGSQDAELKMVEVVRLDDALADLPRADLIKIDVEGFEAPALAGMAALIRRSPDAAIICEFNYAHWSRFGDPLRQLAETAGSRKVYRIFGDGHLAPLDPAGLSEFAGGDLIAYLLLLPPTPERLAQIGRFLESSAVKRDAEPVAEEASSAAALDVQQPADPEPAPDSAPSFLKRVVRGLARRLQHWADG
jgi:FkbM family methyltransferase